MRRREVILGLAVAAALSGAATAQQPQRLPVIGFLAASPLSTIKPRVEAFRQGLRELTCRATKHRNRVALGRGPAGSPALARQRARAAQR